MKFLLFALFLLSTQNCYFTYADSCYYAQIINPNTYLYRDYGKSVLFELPQTYFVYISDYSKGYYTASYDGIKGYVKASEVKVIKEIPQNPYLKNATFRLFASDHNMLKTRPSALAEDITALPTDTPIVYIGKVPGTELIKGRGTSWYYCTYNAEQKYAGYIYAGLCDNLSITYNTEKVSYMQNPYITISSEYIEYLNSPAGKKLVIVPIIIFSLLFMIMLFLPYFIKNHKTKPSSIYFIEDGKL